ncbi:MAG: sodium-translocating pyrophosphatase [Candidatus Heimdallarchaeota archaeon]|nr:sodium-translocating pyrophosphatase [Candidatus Heimdallarchaeota archaeon]
MDNILLLIALITGVISILAAIYFTVIVMRKDRGNEKMIEISGYIETGAKSFLKVQYLVLGIFVLVLFLVILLFLPSRMTGHEVPILAEVLNWKQAVAYLIGSGASMFAGYLGLIVGVKTNTRAAQGVTKGIKEGFDIAFFGGAVMGLAVVGVALLGVGGIYWIFAGDTVESVRQATQIVLGFSFGASGIALFMKCGGGIFTKTADVGADLVGKAEYNLPEDDVRNPATIADNVGDNVGDIAGMGSDLLDSYVASIVAAMILGTTVFAAIGFSPNFVILPILLSSAGLIASLIGIFLIKYFGGDNPGKSLNLGTYLATVLFAVFAALIIWVMISQIPSGLSSAELKATIWKYWKDYIAVVLGLLSGIIIGWTSDYYTREDKKPTRTIAESAEEGHAVVVLSGLAYGLQSVVLPAAGIIVAMAVSFILDGVFGVAMAAVGMLAIVGTIVSNDAYGPIVDNSRAIAEQGGLGEDIIRKADTLDSAGNTAKAITKGFAIGAANLAVLALLFSFIQEAGIVSIDILNVKVLIGAFIGVIIPAVFSALLILSVQKNAAKMVKEIRRQFTENPGILKGTEPADFNRTIAIATKGALRELVLPSVISIVTPILVGVVFGVAALGAFLAGAILSGFVFAIFMSNAGGSFDNAKKWIEDGNLGGKGTDTHKAAITGDTVGDPLKDTAGPSINTLLVVMSLTASMFMGLLAKISSGQGILHDAWFKIEGIDNQYVWIIIVLLAGVAALGILFWVIIKFARSKNIFQKILKKE